MVPQITGQSVTSLMQAMLGLCVRTVPRWGLLRHRSIRRRGARMGGQVTTLGRRGHEVAVSAEWQTARRGGKACAAFGAWPPCTTGVAWGPGDRTYAVARKDARAAAARGWRRAGLSAAAIPCRTGNLPDVGRARAA